MTQDLVNTMRTAGIVGAGGAGFPTYKKYEGALAAKAKDPGMDPVVIANAAECEALLEVDMWMIRNRPREFLNGMVLARDLLGGSRAVVAIKKKHPHEIAVLRDHLPPGVELHLMGNYYPAGDEHVIVADLLGKVVPEQGIPIAVGAVVNNVATFVNLHDAATAALPVTSRYVTVAGEVARPVTVDCPIGTSYADLLALAKPTIKNYRLLIGGPMMGCLADSDDLPVTKTTSGVLVLPADHPLVMMKRMKFTPMLARARGACCQCSMCTEACPRFLLGHDLKPHAIIQTYTFKRSDVKRITSAFLCTECNVCTVVCPNGISPRLLNAEIKAMLRASGGRYERPNQAPKVHDFQKLRSISFDRMVGRLGLNKYAHSETEFVPRGAVAPREVTILMGQHIGAPAVPCVKPGDAVRPGDAVGVVPPQAMGADVHASIEGRVVEATPRHVKIRA